MIGDQAINSFMEMLVPFLKKIYKRTGLNKTHTEEAIASHNQWTEDYKLLDTKPQGLLHEYLEVGM